MNYWGKVVTWFYLKLIDRNYEYKKVESTKIYTNNTDDKKQDTLYCRHCGKELPKYAIYCNKCGNKV